MTSVVRAVLAVFVSAIAVGCSSGPATDPQPEVQARGPVAEIDFEVGTFDGDTFALAEHRGTPVVINFWESW